MPGNHVPVRLLGYSRFALCGLYPQDNGSVHLGPDTSP